jgi:uncharacterized membrane protein
MFEQGKLKRSLGAALLREETLDKSAYEEYRMNLELALNRAERFEKIVFHICWASLLVALVLMFVGGSQVVGSFDPYDETANPLSITLGIIYVLANIAWPLSLASLYSRFRPRIRSEKQELSDAKIDNLQREVEELREGLGERAE